MGEDSEDVANRILWIANINPELSDDALKAAFQQFGDVERARIVRVPLPTSAENQQSEPIGPAFVLFKSAEVAKRVEEEVGRKEVMLIGSSPEPLEVSRNAKSSLFLHYMVSSDRPASVPAEREGELRLAMLTHKSPDQESRRKIRKTQEKHMEELEQLKQYQEQEREDLLATQHKQLKESREARDHATSLLRRAQRLRRKITPQLGKKAKTNRASPSTHAG